SVAVTDLLGDDVAAWTAVERDMAEGREHFRNALYLFAKCGGHERAQDERPLRGRSRAAPHGAEREVAGHLSPGLEKMIGAVVAHVADFGRVVHPWRDINAAIARREALTDTDIHRRVLDGHQQRISGVTP